MKHEGWEKRLVCVLCDIWLRLKGEAVRRDGGK